MDRKARNFLPASDHPFLGLGGTALAAQETHGELQTQESQKCAALAALNLKGAPGGPAVIISAHLVEVPASGLEPPLSNTSGLPPSGYGGNAVPATSRIKQYCDVTQGQSNAR
jgi:hypothetical protein